MICSILFYWIKRRLFHNRLVDYKLEKIEWVQYKTLEEERCEESSEELWGSSYAQSAGFPGKKDRSFSETSSSEKSFQNFEKGWRYNELKKNFSPLKELLPWRHEVLLRLCVLWIWHSEAFDFSNWIKLLALSQSVGLSFYFMLLKFTISSC